MIRSEKQIIFLCIENKAYVYFLLLSWSCEKTHTHTHTHTRAQANTHTHSCPQQENKQVFIICRWLRPSAWWDAGGDESLKGCMYMFGNSHPDCSQSVCVCVCYCKEGNFCLRFRACAGLLVTHMLFCPFSLLIYIYIYTVHFIFSSLSPHVNVYFMCFTGNTNNCTESDCKAKVVNENSDK